MNNILNRFFNKNFYKIEGNYQYHVEVSTKGNEPYSNSSMFVQIFSNSDKKVALACKVTFYKIINGQEIQIQNRKSNFLHFSVELSGLQIMIKIVSLESYFKGSSTIITEKLRINPHLTQRLGIYFPENQQNKLPIKFGHVKIQIDKNILENCILVIEQFSVVIENHIQDYYEQYSLKNQECYFQNIYYREKEVEFQDKKLIIQFENREEKEFFLACQNLIKHQIVENFQFQLIKRNVQKFDLINENLALQQENYFLCKQLRELKVDISFQQPSQKSKPQSIVNIQSQSVIVKNQNKQIKKKEKLDGEEYKQQNTSKAQYGQFRVEKKQELDVLDSEVVIRKSCIKELAERVNKKLIKNFLIQFNTLFLSKNLLLKQDNPFQQALAAS